MKTGVIVVLKIVLIFMSMSVFAKESFRLTNGQLIKTGMNKFELIALVGTPMHEEVESDAVDDGRGDKYKPIKREILMYKLKGSIGGQYFVIIQLNNSEIISIQAKQVGRM